MTILPKRVQDVPIKQIDLSKIDEAAFSRRCVGCLILTYDNKILLQQRDKNCRTYSGCLATFGGGIDLGESPTEALVRELREELGARVNVADVISLGAITEEASNHSELIYVYFWHDKERTITGCYEGKANRYGSCVSALKQPNIMNDVCWLLIECQNKHLVNLK